MFKSADITVVILAGGLGKRLRSKVSGRPKVLAEVGKVPFLQKLLDQVNAAGFKDVVLCTGYLGNQIKGEFGNCYKNLKLIYSQEKSPLGTAGALRLALPLQKTKRILVMNGDSFCNTDFKGFLKFHFDKKADVSLVLTKVLEPSRYGSINLGSDERILGFEEKRKGNINSWINAGIYLLERPLIARISKGINISLERKVFPRWTKKKFFGYKSRGKFLDIGTPLSYAQSDAFFSKNRKQKKRFILLDRDGTLVVHHPYLSHPDQIELIEGAASALKEFKKWGLGVLLITNQAGVGRGFFDLKTLDKIHGRLNSLLADEGVAMDDIYFCPHTPEDSCLCRKPNTALIEKAMKKHNFDPRLCFVIGDNHSDIQLGKNIGATTILVRTGHGRRTEKEAEIKADFVVEDLKGSLAVIKPKL